MCEADNFKNYNGTSKVGSSNKHINSVNLKDVQKRKALPKSQEVSDQGSDVI